jgi:chemotaxis signal transduction protein/anti-anti-sigma regulatory factor
MSTAKTTAGADKSAAGNREQYLTFMLAGEEYGVDILRVQEIKGWDKVTRIPHTPDYVLGVINLRGAVVPILDLRRRFGLESIAFGPTTVVIVMRVVSGPDERTVGVVVDQAAAGRVRQCGYGLRQGARDHRGQNANSARHRPTHRQQHCRRNTAGGRGGVNVSKKKPPRSAKSPRMMQPAHIELDARLTIVQAADLQRTLSTRLAQGGPVIVDGTRVEEIDTAILQLLTSLWRTSLERGIACTWHGASEPLRQTASLVGVAAMLHFPDAEPARDRGHVA